MSHDNALKIIPPLEVKHVKHMFLRYVFQILSNTNILCFVCGILQVVETPNLHG